MQHFFRSSLVAVLVLGSAVVRNSEPATGSSSAPAPSVAEALAVLANEPTDTDVEGDWSRLDLLSSEVVGEHLVFVGTAPGPGRSMRVLTGVLRVDTDGTWAPVETTDHPSNKRYVADAYRLGNSQVAVAGWGLRPDRDDIHLPARGGPHVLDGSDFVDDAESGAGTAIVIVDTHTGAEPTVEEGA